MMRLECDPEKRLRTLEDRGLDLLDADIVFAGRHVTAVDDRDAYGEERFVTVGHLRDRLVVVAWTVRGDTRRIISLRKANDREKARYAPALG